MPHPRPRTQISSLAKVGGAGCGRAASDLKWQVGQVGAGGEVCTCVWGWSGEAGPSTDVPRLMIPLRMKIQHSHSITVMTWDKD